jgi:hypothetical protein
VLYRAWCPDLAPIEVRVAEEREPARRGAGTACFYSRGVDSTYSSVIERPERVTCLVFVDGVEPLHDRDVRAREVDLAAGGARLLGLPLVVVETNLRELTDPVIRDWEDMVGAALAFFGTSLGGGARRVVIPATNTTLSMGPCGTSPLLDPLFSTAAVEVLHDSVLPGRNEKVAWLAAHRPELLSLLKVCYEENREDNCGRCRKCRLTMVALEAAGALRRADGFPDSLDPAAVTAHAQFPSVQSRLDWSQAALALPSGPLRDAILEALRSAPAPDTNGPPPDDTPGFKRRHQALVASLLRDGRPWPPLPDAG